MTAVSDTANPADAEDVVSVPDRHQRSVAGPADEKEMSQWMDQWGHEVDSVVHADPRDVVLENNVRSQEVTTNQETVRNYKQSGVTTAANGYRSMDGTIVVRSGQRRVHHALAAGTTVPVWMHLPPQGDETAREIDRVMQQLDENDHREPLTHKEHTQAYQYLLELGMSAQKIARRRGQRRKDVQQTLEAGASELATAAGDRYGLTLPQLAEIAWFDGQGLVEQTKQLIVTAAEAPRNFATLAQKYRNDLREIEIRQELAAAVAAELEAAGVTTVGDDPETALPLSDLRLSPETPQGTELTADDHASCPGHAARVGRKYFYGEEEDPHDIGYTMVARHVCLDPFAHGHARRYAPDGQADAAAPAGHDADAAEAQHKRAVRRWVRESNKMWDAAAPARERWLKDFARRRRNLPADLQSWLAVQKAQGDTPVLRAMERNHPLARTLLGEDDLPAHAARLDGKQAAVFDAFLTLAAHEEALRRVRSPSRQPTQLQQAYLSTLQEYGHTLSDIELKVLSPDDEDEAARAFLQAGQAGDEDDLLDDSDEPAED